MEAILKRFGSHSAIIGFEPVNEPWANSPLEVLYDFYRAVRKLVQNLAPQAYFVFHEAFMISHQRIDAWKDLFAENDR